MNIQKLTKELATKYSKQIVALLKIPKVTRTEKDLLAETKGTRKLNAKFKHSLIVFDAGKPIAVLLAYERESERNDQYPSNSIYIDELAVHKDYQRQGIAKQLINMPQ